MNDRLAQPGCLHYIDGNVLYASRGGTILTGVAGGALELFARLPVKGRDLLCSNQRALGRLLRAHVYHVTPFEDRIIVMGFSRIWCFDAATARLLGPPVPIVGSRPLTLCVAPHGLYYGEYRSNAQRMPVRVFFSDDGLVWRVVHELTHVRHVHGVYYDRYADCLWMTTGDRDDEAGIWRTTNRFRTVDAVLSGSQQTRAITLLFTKRDVFFGSDTPDEQNYLYRLDRASGTVTPLVAVEGSVFHGAHAGERLLFSTAVEPSTANPSRDAVLYASTDGMQWHAVAKHRKDRWPMTYFQYGQLPLPAGENETGRYWYSTFAAEPDERIFSGAFVD